MASSDSKKMISIMKENAPCAYLATCEGDEPRLRPVSPIVEDDLSIWVTTFSNSRKVRQIKANPSVCLSFVDHPDGDRSAVVYGTAEIVEDMKAKKRVWDMAPFNLLQYFPDGPASKDYCLLRIIANKVEWRESWTGGTKVYEPGRKGARIPRKAMR